jgi:amino acid efflux transporter
MALTSQNQPARPHNLTTSRGAALYIGAILGPGLLLLPGLAAAEAGPASILAWLALLGLSGLFAAVFSALGRRIPSAGGVMGYVTAGLGPRAGRATGWMFLAGVVGGAPIVCLIGASYVTDLTGGGLLARAAVAGALLLTVIGLAAKGLRASAAAQLVLVGLLTAVVVVAVAGSAPAARAGNWTPFAPHGLLSVGRAATTLMFSFVGWEAVAPLTTRFPDPSRQLPRAVAIALAFTTVLYLGLAVATISVLGPRAATDVPLAGLLTHAVGTAGPDVAAVAAIVLTIGAVNAYVSGAAAVAGQLVRAVPGRRRATPTLWLLAAIVAAGLLLITAYGLRIVSADALVAVPTVLFLTVYLGAMAAAMRVLRGPARLAALPGALAVTVMLGFSGWALAIPAVIALASCRPRSAVAAGDGHGHAHADHGQPACPADHLDAARGTGEPAPDRARREPPGAVRDRSDEHRDQRQDQHLLRHVPGGTVHELRQDRAEQDVRLGIGQADHGPVARRAPSFPRRGRHRHGLGQRLTVADRVDAQPDQVQRTCDLHDHERLGRPLQQRAQADGHERRHDVIAGRVAERGGQRGPASVRQRPPDHEQHSRPGDHDQHQRRQREAQ